MPRLPIGGFVPGRRQRPGAPGSRRGSLPHPVRPVEAPSSSDGPADGAGAFHEQRTRVVAGSTGTVVGNDAGERRQLCINGLEAVDGVEHLLPRLRTLDHLVRAALFGTPIPFTQLGTSLVVAILVGMLGFIRFRQLERTFADRI